MDQSKTSRGQWMALTAAILGWMFDGFEIGLFPLVAQPALKDMLSGSEAGTIGNWIGVMTAAFLVGAATGGVIFGWLGDRIGRVRAMSLSILTYAIFSGLCGFANAPWQLFLFRFIAALGMGGEWSLGVSLVMELWPNKSRGWLAGLIGAAANVGFVAVAVLSMTLVQFIAGIKGVLSGVGLSEVMVEQLTSNGAWRLLAISGAFPALLTFLIRIFVPESEKWLEEQEKGNTKQWSTNDLLAVVVGAAAAIGLVALWALDNVLSMFFEEAITIPMWLRVAGTVIGLGVAYYGYTYPIRQYLLRSMSSISSSGDTTWTPQSVLRRMLIGATLSGVALLGTWASLQNAAPWAGELEESRVRASLSAGGELTEEGKLQAQKAAAVARSYTQIASGIGAIVGTILAALAGDWLGRRLSYFVLCLGSLGASFVFFGLNTEYGTMFLATVFLAGGVTASFYGWLPLYLPELFPTRVRAFGQGFAFNFGRILAAVGALQFSFLMKNVFDGSFPKACMTLSLIYILGMLVIWLAPETRGKELPG